MPAGWRTLIRWHGGSFAVCRAKPQYGSAVFLAKIENNTTFRLLRMWHRGRIMPSRYWTSPGFSNWAHPKRHVTDEYFRGNEPHWEYMFAIQQRNGVRSAAIKIADLEILNPCP